MEPQQPQKSHLGIVIVLLLAVVTPLYLAALMAAWGCVPAAWHLLVSQFMG